MKITVVILIAMASFVAGSLLGYYFGYDIGFEKGVLTGKTYTQDIGNEAELSNLIVVDYPRPNQIVKSPLVITGRARGYWFFEASAPVRILDKNGDVLAEKYIESIDEWMTEDFVVFSGEITFNPAGSNKGTIILQNDNPSGLPENIKELRIPIHFE